MLRRLAFAALLALAPSLATAQFAVIAPTAPPGDNSDRIASTAFVAAAVGGGGSLALASGKIFIGSAGNIATGQTMSGDATLSIAGALTLATVSANVGTFGSNTQCVTVTNNAKGLTTAVSAATCTPAIGSITGLGTGVAAALAANVNASGGIVSPTPTRAGDILYWSGSAWATLPGNNSGTQFLQETSAGVPSWATVSGTGTVTTLTAGAGIVFSSGATCTTACTVSASLTTATNSLSGNVALSNISNYFDGPSMAQGTSGTWYASGNVLLQDTAGAAQFYCKLWDGTTVIDSNAVAGDVTGRYVPMHLSGVLATPAANIRISCRDLNSTSANIIFNLTGNSKDSTVTGFRIQ